MEHASIKALFIVINAGHADEVMDIARETGAQGATILKARGTNKRHEVIMGISVDSEKEIILCLCDITTSEKIMQAIKEKSGIKTPAHSVCFTMPVDRVIGINPAAPED